MTTINFAHNDAQPFLISFGSWSN